MTIDEATCGKGLAASATLPTRMAELAAALADVLTGHTESLDADEPAGDQERQAWLAVAAEHRDLAARLSAVADVMSAQHDLPVADHDVDVLTNPESTATLTRFVAAQQRLRDLLDEQLPEYQQMLEGMRP